MTDSESSTGKGATVAEQSDLAPVEIAERARADRRLAIDTEFVSEGRYRPLLCLVQVAVAPRGRGEESEVAVLDPLAGFDHAPGMYLRHSGSQFPGRPSLGSWVAYGLGSATDSKVGAFGADESTVSTDGDTPPRATSQTLTRTRLVPKPGSGVAAAT